MLSDYIRNLRANGHYSFVAKKAMCDLGISRNALACAVYKLKKKNQIISPARGLYIPIPAEYQEIGSLPAEELVPILMKFYGLEYYVCLLSAAYYFGASHQKPQIYQVMVNKQLQPIKHGKVSINFIYKKKLPIVNSTVQRVVKTGYLELASPELTLIDLFLYPSRSGGLNHIATVISELIEEIDLNKLDNLCIHISEHVWMQRLGYMLETIETFDEKKQLNLIYFLEKKLDQGQYNYIPLAPEISSKNSDKNNRWKIIENIKIESDL